jgi:benzoyl-CoA-dihydrodiol lyase
MEANLRFAGPETMETKIFGRSHRLARTGSSSAPTQPARGRPSSRYGSGVKANFNPERV